MDKQTYDAVYDIASKLDEAAVVVDGIASKVVDFTAHVAANLEGYAETLRTQADLRAVRDVEDKPGSNWTEPTDDVPPHVKIDLGDVDLSNLPEQVRRVMNRFYSSKGNIPNVDGLLRDIFKPKEPGSE